MRRLSDSVREAGIAARTATYVYDLDRLRARCRNLMQMQIPRKRVFFATMANDHPDILSCVRSCGLGAFVNSLTHLALARQAGFSPENIVFAASNMLPEELEECVSRGVNLVLDSVGQIDSLRKVVGRREIEIGIRLNVGSSVSDHTSLAPDPAYRFGVTPDEIPSALEAARRGRISIRGAHCYFGTGVMQAQVLIDGLERLSAVSLSLPDLEYLDVAGGMGVPDDLAGSEFDLHEYSRLAAVAMAALERKIGRSVTLYVEPGRYTVADSGYYFARVVDCKLRPDRAFVGTNGSVATFPRMLIYPTEARHPCELVGRSESPVHPLPIYICGNSTYSQDLLARGVRLPLPRPGDVVAFHNAGAYGRSMMSRFLGKDAPAEVLVTAESVLPVAVSA
jgi:diaminopimelate decarboxylase